MRQSTRRRRRHRQAGVSQLVAIGNRDLWRLAAAPPPMLSRDARRRLAMLEWHERHGRTVSRTARHFGSSRPTVYRWLARSDRRHLASLEDRSSRPRRCRRPTWTLQAVEAVRERRERYPRGVPDKPDPHTRLTPAAADPYHPGDGERATRSRARARLRASRGSRRRAPRPDGEEHGHVAWANRPTSPRSATARKSTASGPG